MAIIIAILVFGFLIFVHELGHLAVAKINDVCVEEFAIGMGPKLFGKQYGETVYSLRLFPIGGYCAMVGEAETSDNPRGFDKKTVWQRIAIILAGPVMNFLSALVIFILVFMIVGTPSSSNEVGKVMPDGVAYQAGMMANDKIVSIDGVATHTWNDAVKIISTSPNKTLAVTVLRNDSDTVKLSMTPGVNPETGNGIIGIMSSRDTVPFFKSIEMGVKQTYNITATVLVSLKMMVTGEIAPDVAGPVGIVSIVGDVAPQGMVSILILMAALSVNLGLINLFPIPALDGSRIIFLIIEGIRKKPIDQKVEGTIHFVGFALLMMLMVVITYSDISKLWG